MAVCARCEQVVSEERVFAGARMRDGTVPDSAKFCSYECCWELAAQQVDTSVKCAVCPRTFQRHRDQRGRRRVFCSDKCRRAHESAIQRALRAIGKPVPGPRGDSVADLAEAVRTLEAFDSDLQLLAAKFKNEGAPDILIRQVNDTRYKAASTLVKTQDFLRVRAAEASENQKNAGTFAAIRAKTQRRREAGEAALQDALAKYGKGAAS